jgi:hypothetical protein
MKILLCTELPVIIAALRTIGKLFALLIGFGVFALSEISRRLILGWRRRSGIFMESGTGAGARTD